MKVTRLIGVFAGGSAGLLGLMLALASAQPASSGQRKTLVLSLPGGAKLETVLIPAGQFQMGAADKSKDGLGADERPQHLVRISKPFYLGKTEVTQAQWKAVMGNNPSKFTGDPNLPVESVTWEEAQAFGRHASKITGRTVRLPTEAEWEYACRAGSTSEYGPVADEKRLGEFAAYGCGQTALAGSRKPNAWGLYDMQGNVWEWCQDWYGPYSAGKQVDPAGPEKGSVRVLRGGCWNSDAYNSRCTNRLWCKPAVRRFNTIGFRVAVSE